jgi:hypothetical protein
MALPCPALRDLGLDAFPSQGLDELVGSGFRWVDLDLDFVCPADVERGQRKDSAPDALRAERAHDQ